MIGGTTYLGYLISSMMKMRILELHEVDRVLGYIEGELRYNHSLLYEAVEKSLERADACLEDWLLYLKEALRVDSAGERSVNEVWRDSLNILYENTELKEEDIQMLASFGQALGYLDIYSQENAIQLERNRLQEAISNLEESLKSRRKLAFTMSFLGGLGAVIILL